MEKMRMESPDLTQANIDKIAELFPGVITETKDENGKLKKAVNFDLLKQALSSEVLEGDEAYEFTWVGKKASIVEAGKPIRKTLRPVVEKETKPIGLDSTGKPYCSSGSKNWDTTENLYIEGDNLDVLKLLQESYLGKVKMIYIDPPYNTGNDFIYRDNFTMDKDDYDEEAGVYDEDGNKLFLNSKSRGRFHSDWCSMMHPRLVLARNLLRSDGVIFISIDDHEIHNVKKICDEVFGAGNFVAQLVCQVNPRGRHLDLYVAKTHEYILIYVKTYGESQALLGLSKEGKMLEEYNRIDNNGKYRLLGLRNRNQAFNPQTRPKLYFALFVNPLDGSVNVEQSVHHTDDVYPDAPDGTKTCWTWSKQKIIQENFLLIAEKSGSEWRIFRKDYLFSGGTKATTLAKSLWDDKEFSNDYGRSAIKQLFGSSIMDFPKSSNMLERLVTMGSAPNSIILDFFSGSATTAHAVMQLNAEDGGKRKFIMVQLPEICPPESEAAKAGYKNICEIGKERIRRAGEKIKADNADKEGIEKLDIGFRVLKLDSTNMKDVYYGAAEYDQAKLTDLINNIKEDRDDADLLYSCLLEWGLPLSLPHTSEQIENITVHTYNNGDLIACFAPKISETLVREIAKRQPLRVVFRDSSFANAPAKINVEEIFKLLAPNTQVKVL